ncbi:hypothetical protein KFE25_008054 [Diacronema lutheri]|uniref:PITH domain-containing protein n=1 Tax=Diacronema lutheri TaxID=2081491 RepID=A0A8J5XWC8_DIALT|nr:hypothetical protein KFE25_008054 [Diacronema lutheri]
MAAIAPPGSSAVPSKALEAAPLSGLVAMTGTEVLNAANPQALGAVLTTGSVDAPMRSDCDEQLLIAVPFNQPVKLHSLLIQAAEEGAPRTLKLYVNRSSMGFDDTESFPPTQVLELSRSDFAADGSATVALNFVKFQCVQSLTLFIADNQQGSDVTALARLQFVGMPIQATNVNDLKKQG